MMRELDRQTFTEEFFNLAAEVECGDHFDASCPEHVQWLEDHIALRFASGARFFASYVDGTPIGFTAVLVEPAMSGVPFTGQYSEVVAIGVLPEHRRCGHGSRLLRHSESYARDRGASCLYVATYEGSRDTIRFYESNGFTLVATLPDVYGPKAEGRVYLRKSLQVQSG